LPGEFDLECISYCVVVIQVDRRIRDQFDETTVARLGEERVAIEVRGDNLSKDALVKG
jgi:hypothetical protein